jgi:hypothetical protein
MSTLPQSVAELAIQSGLCVHPAHTAGTAGSQCAHSVPVFCSVHTFEWSLSALGVVVMLFLVQLRRVRVPTVFDFY